MACELPHLVLHRLLNEETGPMPRRCEPLDLSLELSLAGCCSSFQRSPVRVPRPVSGYRHQQVPHHECDTSCLYSSFKLGQLAGPSQDLSELLAGYGVFVSILKPMSNRLGVYAPGFGLAPATSAVRDNIKIPR